MKATREDLLGQAIRAFVDAVAQGNLEAAEKFLRVALFLGDLKADAGGWR